MEIVTANENLKLPTEVFHTLGSLGDGNLVRLCSKKGISPLGPGQETL